MGKSQYLCSAQENVAAIGEPLTRYVSLNGTIQISSTAVEAEEQQVVREAGTFSNMFWRVTANDSGANPSITITLRKNAANTAITLTFANVQTGVKEDTTHTDTVADNDLMVYGLVTAAASGARSVTFGVAGMQFSPTTATNTSVGYFQDNITHDADATTVYIGLNGAANFLSTATKAAMTIKTTAIGRGFRMNVFANGRTDTVTASLCKNGTGTSQSLSYATAETGIKEDTSNTDSLDAGDTYCFQFISAGGTSFNNLVLNSLEVTVQSTAWSKFGFLSCGGDLSTNGGAATDGQIAINLTVYQALSSRLRSALNNTTESSVQFTPRFTTYLTELGVYVIANGFSAASLTVRTRDAGANGVLSVVFTSGQTGLKENDAAPFDTITSATDAENIQLVTTNSGTGTAQISYISVWGSEVSPVLPTGDVFSVQQAVPRAALW
jgi:hypothetical protein